MGGTQKILAEPFYGILYFHLWNHCYPSKKLEHFFDLKEEQIHLLNFLLGEGEYKKSGWCHQIQKNGNDNWSVVGVSVSYSFFTKKLLINVKSEARNISSNKLLSADKKSQFK